jgi:hypothetical protein
MAYKSILVHADLSRHAPAHRHRGAAGARAPGAPDRRGDDGRRALPLENNRGMRGDAVAAHIAALYGRAEQALDSSKPWRARPAPSRWSGA